MAVRAVDLRKGTVLEKDGDLLLITEFIHKTPGNLRAIIQIKTKSLTTGQANNMRLSSGDMLEVAYLDRKKAEYLYKEANGDFVFMDADTFDQFALTSEFVGDRMGYVKENETVEVTFHGTTPIGIELPTTVTLQVTEAEAAVKGNTATNVKKDAVVETGMAVKVPLHVNAGDLIKINTDTGEFQGRVKE
jgi:elongation factor P